MKRLQMIFLALFFAVAASAWAQGQEPLKLIHTIPVSGLHDGDFDHFMVNLPTHRLFLAAEENGKVIAIDTRTNKILHVITDLSSPHSMVFRRDLNKLFVVDGDASEIKVYNGTSYQLIQHIPMTIDADSIAYDPATKVLYVVSGGRAAHTPYSFIEIIDTTNSKVTGKIKIDTNRIEALALEKSGPYIYANLTGENAIGEVNRVKRSLVATWPIASEGKVNVALAYDEPDHRLFTVTRDPGKVIVLDSNSGKIITSMPCV
ncbi:MAG: YncE family protein, partial [Terriglobia bacterium]